MEDLGEFPKYVFIMRHAEKVSNVTGEKTPNTSITKNGEEQALTAGKFIAKQIKKIKEYNPEKKVLLMVSPY